MATDLTGLVAELKVSLEAKPQKGIDLAIPEALLKIVKGLTLAFGTGLGKSNQVWFDRRAIAGNGNDPLDLVGTLKNCFNTTINLANVKAIVIFNRSDESLAHGGGSHTATDAALKVGDTASTFQGPFITQAKGVEIPPGGIFVITNPQAAGWTVGGGDILQVDNADAVDEALYDVAIIGEST